MQFPKFFMEKNKLKIKLPQIKTITNRVFLFMKELKRLRLGENLSFEKIGAKKKEGKEPENKNMVFVQVGKYIPSFFNRKRVVSNLKVLKYPVTQDMWVKLMRNNPSNFVGGRNPVDRISWWEALEYYNKLSVKCRLESQCMA